MDTINKYKYKVLKNILIIGYEIFIILMLCGMTHKILTSHIMDIHTVSKEAEWL